MTPLISFRYTFTAIGCAAALLLGGCSNSIEDAQQEAAIARNLFEAGNLPAARAAIQRALSHRDDQLDILLLDARIKYAMEDVRSAYEAYRTVLVFDPNNMEALSLVSQLGIVMAEPDVARDAIERALEIDPERADILMSRGVLYLNDREYDEAIAAADRLLEILPGDSRGVVVKSRALFQKGERQQAFDLLNETVEQVGNDPLLATALLEIARSEGRIPIMLEQYAFLGPRNPQSAELALDEINTRYKSGDVDGARTRSADYIERFGYDASDMDRLIDLWREYDSNPLRDTTTRRLASSDRVAARLAAARFFLGQNDLDRAETFIENAPDSRFMGFIARLHVRNGSSEGPALARQILEFDRTNCDALSAMVEWNLREGDNREAIVNGQLLAAECRDRLDGYQGLAQAYKNADQPTSVERVYREGIEVHPQSPDLTEEFANWLVEQGRGRTAISAVRRLGNAAPSRISTWQVYARICEKVGDSVCAEDAAAGLARARTLYVLDPLPGVRRRDPLFGRTWT